LPDLRIQGSTAQQRKTGMVLVVLGCRQTFPIRHCDQGGKDESRSISEGLPVMMQEINPESPTGRAFGAMFDSMCKVVSACLPIFDQAMESLREGVSGGWGPSR